MPHLPRTTRDRDLSDILKRLGPLTNRDLTKEASKYPHFKGMTDYAIEKAVDRFVKDYVNLGVVVRDRGKVEWLPKTQRTEERTIEARDNQPEVPESPTPFADSRAKTVQRLIQGFADGSITLRNKSPHKELNWIKGEIFDDFMADIEFYSHHPNEGPVSWAVETRIYNTALKLRAYGFLEEKELSRPTEDKV